MVNNNVTSIIDRLLRKTPVEYTIQITHDSNGFFASVSDLQEDDRSKLAIADDLERLARLIRDEQVSA